jgi:hypothetical protein
MATLRLHFADGEIIDGESDDASSQRHGFIMRPHEGNNELAWVPFSALKYCQYLTSTRRDRPDARAEASLQKLILRFNDGEVVRAYKDEVFTHDGSCLNVMTYAPALNALCRTIVPYSALKAIFFVKTWDSRETQESELPLTPYAGKP